MAPTTKPRLPTVMQLTLAEPLEQLQGCLNFVYTLTNSKIIKSFQHAVVVP